MAKSDQALGRLPEYSPVGVVDIGSNSVRLVIYDGARRSPTPVFNEKVLCGLGRGIATTGRMSETATDRALVALTRFRAISEQIGARKIYAMATAAAREAENGAEFIRSARKALGAPIRVLTGKDEATYAAMGVLSGIPEAEGVVGDLGGGSLELMVVESGGMGEGTTLPLGPLRLIDVADGSIRRARSMVRDMFADLDVLDGLKGKTLYAVGGAWRNFARIHMERVQYPLHVLHHYHIHHADAESLAHLVAGLSPASLRDIHAISENRAETLPYGALVLEELLKRTGVSELVVSSYGLREGLLYSKLKAKAREQDPLLSAAWDLARLRSRSPKAAVELADWIEHLFKAADIDETPHEERLRRAACLLADIGWRADQDYRGEQCLNIIAHAAFAGVDHPGRAFLALTVFYRYQGVRGNGVSPRLLEIVDERALARAKLIAAGQRLAYALSGFMPGVLPKTTISVSEKRVLLKLKRKYRDLHGEHVVKRLGDVARQLQRSPSIEMDG